MPSDLESESIGSPESESESEQQHHDSAPLATVIIYYDFYCHLYLYLYLYLSMKKPQIRIPQGRGNPGGGAVGQFAQTWRLWGDASHPPYLVNMFDKCFLFV